MKTLVQEQVTVQRQQKKITTSSSATDFYRMVALPTGKALVLAQLSSEGPGQPAVLPLSSPTVSLPVPCPAPSRAASTMLLPPCSQHPVLDYLTFYFSASLSPH